MAEPFRIPEWRRFQHYGKRRPPWIKLHRQLLDDRRFRALSVEARDLLRDFWLLAAESDEGTVPPDLAWIAWRLRSSVPALVGPLTELVHSQWVQGDSEAIAVCKQDAPSVEESRAEQSRGSAKTNPTPQPPTVTEVVEGTDTSEDAVAKAYAVECCKAANRALSEKLAGAYKPLVASVERATAVGWQVDGVPLDVALKAIGDAVAAFQVSPGHRQPHSLRYFDMAVRRAFAMSGLDVSPEAVKEREDVLRVIAYNNKVTGLDQLVTKERLAMVVRRYRECERDVSPLLYAADAGVSDEYRKRTGRVTLEDFYSTRGRVEQLTVGVNGRTHPFAGAEVG